MKKPVDWGLGGLKGFTRAELEEMERIRNLPPPDDTSEQKRKKFVDWKTDLLQNDDVILL